MNAVDKKLMDVESLLNRAGYELKVSKTRKSNRAYISRLVVYRSGDPVPPTYKSAGVVWYVEFSDQQFRGTTERCAFYRGLIAVGEWLDGVNKK